MGRARARARARAGIGPIYGLSWLHGETTTTGQVTTTLPAYQQLKCTGMI